MIADGADVYSRYGGKEKRHESLLLDSEASGPTKTIPLVTLARGMAPSSDISGALPFQPHSNSKSWHRNKNPSDLLVPMLLLVSYSVF